MSVIKHLPQDGSGTGQVSLHRALSDTKPLGDHRRRQVFPICEVDTGPLTRTQIQDRTDHVRTQLRVLEQNPVSEVFFSRPTPIPAAMKRVRLPHHRRIQQRNWIVRSAELAALQQRLHSIRHDISRIRRTYKGSSEPDQIGAVGLKRPHLRSSLIYLLHVYLTPISRHRPLLRVSPSLKQSKGKADGQTAQDKTERRLLRLPPSTR